MSPVVSWFLVIVLSGSDEVLVKQMESKTVCLSEQKNMEKSIKVTDKKKMSIESISCEIGYIEEDGSLMKQMEGSEKFL